MTKIFKTFDAALKEVRKDMLKAAALTLNKTAYNARQEAVQNVEGNFTLRNTFTTRNIQYTKCATAKRYEDLISVVGATENIAYMERQEKGGTRKNPTGGNLLMPTTAARRNNNRNKVSASMYYKTLRQKTITGKNPTRHFSSHKAQFVARAAVAAKIGGFLKMNDAVFKVSRFKKSGDNISFSKKMIYNIKHKTTHTPKKEWLEPAAKKAAEEMQVEFNMAMDMQ